MFEFVYNKMPSFLHNISEPEFNFDNSHLVLANNAVNQLDIFDDNNADKNINTKTKYRCLFDVIDETLTPLGKRYLRSIISSPFVNKEKLNNIYNITDKIRDSDMTESLSKYLSEIRDIERLGRKMELQLIKPQEIMTFISSYENIIEIFNIVQKNKLVLDVDKKLDKKIKQFMDDISSIFDLDKLATSYEINFDEKIQIFNKGVHEDIDELNSNISYGKEIVEELMDKLIKMYLEKDDEIKKEKKEKEEKEKNSKTKSKSKTKKGDENTESISIQNSPKDGNHICVTKNNSNILQKLLNECEEIKYDSKHSVLISNMVINNKEKNNTKFIFPTISKSVDLIKIKNHFIDMIENCSEKDSNRTVSKVEIKNNKTEGYHISILTTKAKILKESLKDVKELDLGCMKVKVSDLIFKENKSNTKIMIPSLNSDADKLKEYVEEISLLYKLHYMDDILNIYEKYSDLFKQCNEFITKVDYYNSCALLSLKRGYVKPVIKDKKHSFVTATKLRHPIVERIIDYEYVPHDISIGNDDMKGMLIYGLNSSGKSVLMKSVGLCIIMAQAGLYVPAESFEFSPYHQLMTRITGNDNIFKGMSSFAVEMTEINSILKRSNRNTLVIGDEICRGTEHISGNAIVASTILKLSKCNPTFIFTTHLHEIMTLESIKKINNVKAFHLKVSYDTKNDRLIFDRTLSPGSGESVYGILVAKYMIQDREFIDCANEIKNELMNYHDSLISGKKSRYNSDLYVYECNLCHTKDNVKLTNLETHHINFQKDCDEHNVVKNKKHMKKNDKSNLVILCQECHDKIHNNEIKLSGFVKTSKGKCLV